MKKREFYTSLLMGMGVIIGGIYLGGMLLGGMLLNAPWLVTLSLMMPLLAWISIFWKETLLRWKNARTAQAHPERERLLALRGLARN